MTNVPAPARVLLNVTCDDCLHILEPVVACLDVTSELIDLLARYVDVVQDASEERDLSNMEFTNWAPDFFATHALCEIERQLPDDFPDIYDALTLGPVALPACVNTEALTGVQIDYCRLCMWPQRRNGDRVDDIEMMWLGYERKGTIELFTSPRLSWRELNDIYEQHKQAGATGDA